MWRDKHDISSTSYIRNLDELTTQYNNLILKAERTNRALGGEVSKEEATLYFQAGKTCEQIMNLNLNQRAVYAKWKALKQDCDARVTQIADILAPKPAKPVPQPAPEPAESVRRAEPADNLQANQPSASEAVPEFTTKNACKDVPADTIKKWFKAKPNHSFDDVTGMEDLKAQLIKEAASLGWTRVDKALNINPVQSYFFYGPPGSGKTYSIEAFAHELMNKGFRFIQLKGGDIHASLVGVAEKTIQIAFQEAVDNEPCLIFIDEIENVCVSRDNHAEGHEKRLTVAFLEAYNILRSSGKRVIFMGATNHPMMVDEAMRDRIKLIKVPLPDEACREQYFVKAFRSVVLEEGFTYYDMVSCTDNYSYRDLSRLCEAIAFSLKELMIQENIVYDEDGNLDQQAADIKASEAIEAGCAILTRAMFEEAQRKLPPSDKTKIREELRRFEESIKLVSVGD